VISSAEAALLISGYKLESKLLRITFSARDMSFSFRLTSTVLEFVEGVRLTPEAPNADHCLVNLRGCLFEYGDTREAPESTREAAEAKFAGVLTIIFPSRERLYLFETLTAASGTHITGRCRLRLAAIFHSVDRGLGSEPRFDFGA
jgi:hypothetical protein